MPDSVYFADEKVRHLQEAFGCARSITEWTGKKCSICMLRNRRYVAKAAVVRTGGYPYPTSSLWSVPVPYSRERLRKNWRRGVAANIATAQSTVLFL